jgi:hypothetical protein
MGKAFLLKKFGLQKVPEHLKCPEVQDAGRCGRILFIDFSRDDNSILSDNDVFTFFQRLILFYLCRLFDGSNVDGIKFEKRSMYQISDLWRRNVTLNGDTTWLDKWFSKCYSLLLDEMIDEYVRLTNIAFGVDCDFPPVFLLDEIGILAGGNTYKLSKYD